MGVSLPFSTGVIGSGWRWASALLIAHRAQIGCIGRRSLDFHYDRRSGLPLLFGQLQEVLF